MKTKLLFIVWVLASVAFIGLIFYVITHGSDADTNNMAGFIGAVWGGAAVFLIGPTWKAMKQLPAPRRRFVLSTVTVFVAVIGFWFWSRVQQTTRLQALFERDREFEKTAAPKKQRFMQLLSEKQNAKTLPEYLQRCADLEPAIGDYVDAEHQVDNLLGQMQQEIGGLKPPGSYGTLLPGLAVLRAVIAKDMAAAEAQKKEIEFAKQLPEIPEAQRAQFYTTNIQPIVEQESKIAQEEVAIIQDAKSRGITLPASVYEGAGIK
jgi:hypothetical protein